jgi:CPA1 family monovalent cation:H+ antiporter
LQPELAMLVFETVIALLMAGAFLAILARRIGAPYPALLALAGTAGAVVPGLPQVTLDPDLALALFVAPTLLDAAFDASPRDLRENWLPVTGLALVSVVCTTAVVALVAHWAAPGMPWAVAIALGAIVAPPDASAAAAVLRQLRPPHRLLVILEGESLFNDASALLIYRVAVGAAVTGHFSGWAVLPQLLLTCGGGALLGVALAKLWFRLNLLQHEVGISVLLQFLGTFAVWLLAERLHLSAIITVVAYAMTLARHAPLRTDGRKRIASYAVWEVAVFVLNVLAFILIGLQLRGILERLDGGRWSDLGFALLASAAAIAVRFAWVMGHIAVAEPANWRGGLVMAWCGMRGIVSIAAALALPEDFPYRDLILLTAFAVVLATLVVQGLTLRWVLVWLGVEDDGAVEREAALAREATCQAALTVLRAAPSGEAAALLRRDYAARLNPVPGEPLLALQRQVIAAQRQALAALRRGGVIGDDAFHRIEEEIDLLELTADPRIRCLEATPAAGAT